MNDTVSLVSAILGLIISSASVITIFYRVMKKFEKRFSEKVIEVTKETINTEIDKVNQKIDAFKAETNNNFNTLKEETNRQIAELKESTELTDKGIKTALVSEARYLLNQAYHIYKSEGKIDDHSYFTLKELFASYESLGGNSFIKDQMKTIEEIYKNTNAD